MQFDTIVKGNCPFIPCVDISDGKAFAILLQMVGCCIEVVSHGEDMTLTLDAILVGDLELDGGPGFASTIQNDAVKIKVTVKPLEVSDFKTFDLNFLDQPTVVGLQRVQHIDRIVCVLMGGGVVQGEERLEIGHCPPCHLAAHLLRFIENQDGVKLPYDIDGATGTEALLFGVNDAGGLVAATPLPVLAFIQRGRKGLCVDNHHGDFGIAGKLVQQPQVGTVVDEEVSRLVVFFAEMRRRVLECALDPLADGDAGHDDDVFRPAITPMQLEDGLDIDVGLARASLHLDVQRTSAQCL